MTTNEKCLMVPFMVLALLLALSWRMWFIAVGFVVAIAFVACAHPADSRTDEGDD